LLYHRAKITRAFGWSGRSNLERELSIEPIDGCTLSLPSGLIIRQITPKDAISCDMENLSSPLKRKQELWFSKNFNSQLMSQIMVVVRIISSNLSGVIFDYTATKPKA
jgi:hypothetical protein